MEVAGKDAIELLSIRHGILCFFSHCQPLQRLGWTSYRFWANITCCDWRFQTPDITIVAADSDVAVQDGPTHDVV